MDWKQLLSPEVFSRIICAVLGLIGGVLLGVALGWFGRAEVGGNNRYVLREMSSTRAVMLDSQTGRVWSIVNASDQVSAREIHVTP